MDKELIQREDETNVMEYSQREGESFLDWKFRLIISKIEKTLDLDWSEIRDILGLDVSSDHLRKTGYGIYEYYKYFENKHNYNNVATRILSISDTHVPYQLPISTFKDYVGKVDILQLNGDILDCQSISKFPKAYRVNMMEEIIGGRQYIIDLIEYIKPKKVIANYGNHELRFQNYLSKNLDSDLLELMPQTPLDLIFTDGFTHNDKRNKTKTYYEPLVNMFDGILIEYTGNWWCEIGKTIFCHPSAFSCGIMKTSEKAMQYFLTINRNFNCMVMSHTHQLGEYIKGNILLYEQGTCSDTSKQNYTDGKLYTPQQEGFLYICHDNDGNVVRDKTKLVKI